MKTLLLALLLAIQASAQNTNLSLRLVGTNLYDFSKAGPAFHIIGPVTKVYPQSIEITILAAEGYSLRDHSPIPGSMMDSSDLLLTLAAFRMGTNPDGSRRLLSSGAYFGLSPAMRLMFEPATKYKKFYLLNARFGKVGQTLNATAVPTINPGFFDCGIPFTGDTNGFKYIYRMVNDKIFKTAIATNQPSANL